MAEEKKIKPPKMNKKGLFKTILTAIPTAIKQYKKKKSKFKSDEKKFVKQQKDKVSTLTTQANKTYNDLTDKQKKIFNSLGNQPGMSTKKKIAIALGLATTAGLSKFGYDVNQEMKKMATGGSALKSVPSNNTGLAKLPTPVRNKMGYMKKGGMAKKRANSSSKKIRGIGAAKRGTKFKGVF